MLTLNGKYGSAQVYTDLIEQEAISQIIGMLNQPFAQNANVAIMPDVHAGAGCTIGTTMRINDCVVPNLVGVDIGCGMNCAELGILHEIDFDKLDKVIREKIPSGMNVHDRFVDAWMCGRPSVKAWNWADELHKLKCWPAIKSKEDYFLKSLGTLGGGNHFIEINKDEDGQYYLVIHSGSRNLGVQVCKYYQKLAESDYKKNRQAINKKIIEMMIADGRKVEIPAYVASCKMPKYDKDLIPLTGESFENYLHDIEIVQEYAQANRQAMMYIICQEMGWYNFTYFETIHNYIDFSPMLTKSKEDKRPILRKGAVAADDGEELIIPMNMRDGSLICIGKGNPAWNYSAPHGAGRLMSRAKAKETLSLEEYQSEMNGIWTSCVSNATIDESPMAYKPMESIVENIKDTVEIYKVIKPVYNFKAN